MGCRPGVAASVKTLTYKNSCRWWRGQVEQGRCAPAESDDGRGTVYVIGRPVAALTLIVGSPHPQRAVRLEGEAVIVAIGNFDDVAKSVPEIINRDLGGKRMRKGLIF